MGAWQHGLWPSDDHPDAELLGSLACRLDLAIAEALGGATRVALLNFPNHDNPGDSALWLGARASLRRLGVTIGYSAVWDTLSPAALRAAVPDGPVLLNGGGNFGDVYQGQQGTRELVLAEFTERPVVQLPQTIRFREQTNLDRNRRLVEQHGRVTILARDAASAAFARDRFEATVLDAPDAAFGLGALPGPGAAPVTDVLWLIRGDGESAGHGGPPPGVDAVHAEWMGAQPDEPSWLRRHDLARRLNQRLRPRLAGHAGAARWGRGGWGPLALTLPPLAAGWTRRGVEILGRGRVVVVDRLHGHVLALLAGLPHIVLDTRQGKVSGTYRTWTHTSALASWADDGDSARDLALQRLGTSTP